jgi:hypothetical protein
VSRFRVERYCLCGAEMIIESDGLSVIRDTDVEFTRRHTGPGHAPCTKRQAAATRRRQLIRDAEELGRE